MRAARLVLLCGLPGSGKTTLARALASQVKAVRFSADEWMAALEIDGYDLHARGRIENLQWAVAEGLLELGNVVIIESGPWQRADRDALRKRCRTLGVPIELRYLPADVDTLWERLRARNASQPWGSSPVERADLEEWATTFEPPAAEELALFDPPAA
jgi:predicted kinase